MIEGSDSAVRVEKRDAGADANPYLAIAACLATGYLGLVEKIEPRAAVETDSYDRPRELPYGLLEGLNEFDVCEPLIGVLLPCNVVVMDTGDGGSRVAAFNPTAGFELVGRPEIDPIATEVEERLNRALDALG